jgi:hypothetical protein
MIYVCGNRLDRVICEHKKHFYRLPFTEYRDIIWFSLSTKEELFELVVYFIGSIYDVLFSFGQETTTK